MFLMDIEQILELMQKNKKPFLGVIFSNNARRVEEFCNTFSKKTGRFACPIFIGTDKAYTNFYFISYHFIL